MQKTGQGKATPARIVRQIIAAAFLTAALSFACLGYTQYWVIAASYTQQLKAFDAAAGISDATGLTTSVMWADVNGIRYYRASAGPFMDRAGADAARGILKNAGWLESWVLSIPTPDPEGEDKVTAPDGGKRLIKVGLSWVTGTSLLFGTDGVITASGKLSADGTDQEFEANLILRLEMEGDGIRVRASEKDEGMLFTSPVRISSSVGPVWVSDSYRIYGGSIEVSLKGDSSGLNAANVIDVEDYLLSVLPAEIGGNAPLEAYKAQAVVARTEALSSANRHPDTGWDLCDGTHCQVFKGMYGQSPNPDIKKSVKETASEVLIYGKEMVRTASFHSACGGITESSEAVWGSSLPHLTNIKDSIAKEGVPDLREEDAVLAYIKGKDKADLCYGSYGYRWTASVKSEDVLRRLKESIASGNAVAETAGSEGKLPKVLSRTYRGAAMQLSVPFEGYDYIIKGELNIRKLLGGTTVIKSGVLAISSDDEGKSLLIVGAGYGHGVGMCQEGAKALARLGKDYKSILRFYYQGSSTGSYLQTAGD